MYLVTGCNGFIGSYVTRRLLAEGFPVRALKRPGSDLSLVSDIAASIEWVEGDVLDVLSLHEAMKNVTYVVHAAAFVAVTGMMGSEKEKMFKVNVEGTANIVNACLSMGVQRLCHISSVAALTEEEHRKGEVVNEKVEWNNALSASPYAESKHLAECEVWRGEAEGLSVCIVNPSVVIGCIPVERSSGQIFKYLRDEPLFYPPGTVNLVDARDVAEATVKLMQSGVQGERFILNAANVPYKEFCEKVAVRLGKQPPRRKLTSFLARAGYQLSRIGALFSRRAPLLSRGLISALLQDRRYDNSKISKALDFRFRPLDETLDWACTYYRNTK